MDTIIMKREQTNKTLLIDGIDAINAMTTNFIPSSLEITLNGLNALRALRAFNALNLVIFIPDKYKIKSISEAVTTKKSRQFQEFLM